MFQHERYGNLPWLQDVQCNIRKHFLASMCDLERRVCLCFHMYGHLFSFQHCKKACVCFNLLHGKACLCFNLLHEKACLCFNLLHEKACLCFNLLHKKACLWFNLLHKKSLSMFKPITWESLSMFQPITQESLSVVQPITWESLSVSTYYTRKPVYVSTYYTRKPVYVSTYYTRKPVYVSTYYTRKPVYVSDVSAVWPPLYHVQHGGRGQLSDMSLLPVAEQGILHVCRVLPQVSLQVRLQTRINEFCFSYTEYFKKT